MELTHACGTMDVLPTPLVATCHVEFHITIDMKQYVVIDMERLVFPSLRCGYTYLAVYDTSQMRGEDLIVFIQCRRSKRGEQHRSDWNTMAVVWHRTSRKTSGSESFLAFYHGVSLPFSAEKCEHYWAVLEEILGNHRQKR